MGEGQYGTGTRIGDKAVFTPTVTPPDPAAGKGYLYFKADGSWYVKSGSTETRLATSLDDAARSAEIVADRARLTALEADTGWINVTYQGTWSDYAPASWGGGAYRRIRKMVHLTGLVKGGTAGTVIFILPVGFRPATAQIHDGTTNLANGTTPNTNTSGSTTPTGGAAHTHTLSSHIHGTNNVSGRVDLYPTGEVIFNAPGDGGYVSLAGIHFLND